MGGFCGSVSVPEGILEDITNAVGQLVINIPLDYAVSYFILFVNLT